MHWGFCTALADARLEAVCMQACAPLRPTSLPQQVDRYTTAADILWRQISCPPLRDNWHTDRCFIVLRLRLAISLVISSQRLSLIPCPIHRVPIVAPEDQQCNSIGFKSLIITVDRREGVLRV
jgi:hypothetical protein